MFTDHLLEAILFSRVSPQVNIVCVKVMKTPQQTTALQMQLSHHLSCRVGQHPLTKALQVQNKPFNNYQITVLPSAINVSCYSDP